jgi:hypothetical protein
MAIAISLLVIVVWVFVRGVRDLGSLSVHVSGKYFWHDAAQGHRVVEEGHTRGKLVLIVDEDLAAALEV